MHGTDIDGKSPSPHRSTHHQGHRKLIRVTAMNRYVSEQEHPYHEARVSVLKPPQQREA